MARYFRIASAVFFALLALAFVALWVRSYYRVDTIGGQLMGQRILGAASVNGVIVCDYMFESNAALGIHQWKFDALDALRAVANERYYLEVDAYGIHFGTPHWLPALLFAALAALFAFKFPRRFTTRGLLIATTVVAGALGLIAYSL